LSEYRYEGDPDRFRLRYPPYWVIAGEGTGDVSFRDRSTAWFDPTSSLVVEILDYCRSGARQIGDPKALEQLKAVDHIGYYDYALRGAGQHVFVTSGKWPLLIPANFVEFNTTLEKAGARVVREIRLETWPTGNRCVSATLLDDPPDVTEQARLDLSRVLASMQFQDPQHPFPVVTPTPMPTPNAAPLPALPLNIKVDARTYRWEKLAMAEIAIEIRDAAGDPLDGAEVVLVKSEGIRNSLGLSTDGRRTTTTASPSSADAPTSVEVLWNQKLIGKQDFVLSWK
jgi:hypothetical protein